MMRSGPRRFAFGASAVVALASLPAHAEDLMAIYALAEQHDPVIASARHALDAAQEKLPQARAGLLPNLAMNANTGRQPGQGSFNGAPYVDRDVRSWAWTLQLTQPVLRAGNWAALDEADAQVRQAAAQHALAQQDLIVRVTQAYFDILAAQDAVTVANAQMQAVQEQQAVAKHAYDVGSATITDVHEAKARFDLARAQRVAAQGELEARQAELERILGAPPGPLAGLDTAAALPAPEPNEAQPWMDQARAQHPGVVMQAAAQEAAGHALRRQRAEHLPTLDVTASRGNDFASGTISSPADIATRTRSTRVGLQLTVPLFAGGGTQSRAREAAAGLARAESDLETARRTAAAQARQAFTGVSTALAQCGALASAVASSRSALQANEVGYRTGTRINIDVLNAQQQLYAAERDLAKARYDTLMQGLRLKAAAGALTADDLRGINALLLPEREPFPAQREQPQ
jgi:outer membrane protein